MSRQNWNIVKQSKNFYVSIYRRLGVMLILSLALSLLLELAIGFFYFTESAPDYYATYGETPPVPLVAMERRNYSAQPLLAEEASSDRNARTSVQ